MTPQELNRDIKRLQRAALKNFADNGELLCTDLYFSNLESKIKPEYRRLYDADNDFSAMNRTSILIMICMNRKYNIIPHHQFGIHLDLDKL